MAIINQSTLVLILITSYSVGLDLFERSKINTQEASLNVVSAPFLLTFEKSPPKHYLIGGIIYLLIMFFLVRSSKRYEMVALDVGQWGPSILERAYFNRAVKHFLS